MQRFPPGSCLNFRWELAHICSLHIKENASQEKSFTCNKHGLCRCYFRGCCYAFVCLLMDRATYWLWNYKEKLSLDISWSVVDATFSQGSLISAAAIAFERCYAIYWPLKHRTMSFKAYYIIIFIIWTLAFLLSAVFNMAKFSISFKAASFCWMSFSLPSPFIVCPCSIGIWRKFQLHEEYFFTATKQSLPKQTLDVNSASRLHHFFTVMAILSHRELSYLYPQG